MIEIPVKLINKLLLIQKLKVIILFEDKDEIKWDNLSAESFLEVFAESDSIYDKL